MYIHTRIYIYIYIYIYIHIYIYIYRERDLLLSLSSLSLVVVVVVVVQHRKLDSFEKPTAGVVMSFSHQTRHATHRPPFLNAKDPITCKSQVRTAQGGMEGSLPSDKSAGVVLSTLV